MDRGEEAPMVLLVHGLWMGGWSMTWLAHKLHGAGFRTCPVSYDSFTGTPQRHVEDLAQAARACSGTVHYIGHSMGGVVVLRHLHEKARSEKHSSGALVPGRAVLLGAPVRGSQAALAFERQPWGGMLLGKSVEMWRSAFPEAIGDGLEVGAIAGTKAIGLGPLFVDLPEPSDGVVTVDETRIPGLRDHLELPVSHTGMLVSDAVARQSIAFLRHGKFEP